MMIAGKGDRNHRALAQQKKIRYGNCEMWDRADRQARRAGPCWGCFWRYPFGMMQQICGGI